MQSSSRTNAEPLASALAALPEAEGWGVTLERLGAAIGARSAASAVFDAAAGVVQYAAVGHGAGSMHDLVDSGAWTSSRFIRAPLPPRPVVAVLPDPSCFPEDSVAGSVARAGMRHHVAAIFAAADGRAVQLTFERAAEAGAFAPDARLRLRLLLPQLVQATRRAICSAERAGQAAFAALARIGAAAALLDIRGGVVAATAEAALDLPPFARDAAGGLTLADRPAATRFAAALRRAAIGECPAPLLVPAPAAAPLALTLAPAAGTRGEGPGAAAAAVLLTIRPAPGASGGLAALSPAERALAELVARGMPTAEAAARRGITLKTARTYLERVHRKTGVTTRAGLVALVLSGR